MKRLRENPKRSIKTWSFDVSKQVAAAGTVHMLNVIFSHFAGFESSIADPCIWYFLNVLIDTTIGIFSLFILLNIWLKIVLYLNLERCQTGNYGNPPKYLNWVFQLVAFLMLVVINKFFIILLLKIPYLSWAAEFLMSPIVSVSRHFELLFVMIIFPTIMNTFQFWITDHILMKKERYIIISDEEKPPMDVNSIHSDDTFLSCKSENKA